jgi:hypothetical protein
LALAEWGQWLDELEPAERTLLANAYVRRKRAEFKALALYIVGTLGESMGGGGGAGGKVIGVGRDGRRQVEVKPDDFLRAAGVTLK